MKPVHIIGVPLDLGGNRRGTAMGPSAGTVATYFSDALERLRPLAEDGLATVSGERVAATPPGRLLLRIIAMCFDRYHAALQ